jgi:hypothetical protein
MAFICPECLQNRLTITTRIELEGDSRSDDIALQLLDCASCGFNSIAVYEESRRGALDAESYDHYGYKISGEDFRSIQALLEPCSNLQRCDCTCPAHQRLNRCNAQGRWNALDEYQKSHFDMRYVES